MRWSRRIARHHDPQMWICTKLLQALHTGGRVARFLLQYASITPSDPNGRLTRWGGIPAPFPMVAYHLISSPAFRGYTHDTACLLPYQVRETGDAHESKNVSEKRRCI